MLFYLYLFSLIFGSVLLGASILLGGHDDVDLDVDADADLDLDVDADADVDTGADGFDKDVDVGGHGDFSGFLYTFLSLRFWTFFLAFFGLTGITLDGLDLVSSPWVGLTAAIAMGFATGLGAVTVLRKLGAETSGTAVSSSDYIGKMARVVVPFDGVATGKVRVDIKGSQVDLLATGLEGEGYTGREEVLIVEMDGSKARVARLEGKKAERG